MRCDAMRGESAVLGYLYHSAVQGSGRSFTDLRYLYKGATGTASCARTETFIHSICALLHLLAFVVLRIPTNRHRSRAALLLRSIIFLLDEQPIATSVIL